MKSIGNKFKILSEEIGKIVKNEFKQDGEDDFAAKETVESKKEEAEKVDSDFSASIATIVETIENMIKNLDPSAKDEAKEICKKIEGLANKRVSDMLPVPDNSDADKKSVVTP